MRDARAPCRLAQNRTSSAQNSTSFASGERRAKSRTAKILHLADRQFQVIKERTPGIQRGCSLTQDSWRFSNYYWPQLEGMWIKQEGAEAANKNVICLASNEETNRAKI
jgi:hypothetical protein